MLSNPVSVLNEYAQKKKIKSPVYGVASQMGEPHNRRFCISCEFISFKTQGIEKTKQDAKTRAAEDMVQLLIENNYLPRATEVQKTTVLVPAVPVASVILQPFENGVVPNAVALAFSANPIGWLQEYCMKKGWKTAVYEEIGVIDGKFNYRCKCSDYAVTGMGFRKQLAKSNAALKMCHLISGTNSADELTTKINKIEKASVITVSPTSSPKTTNSEISCPDSVDSSFLDSSTEQASGEDEGEECKYSISLLYQLVTLARVSRPEFEFSESDEETGYIYTCLCRVITLEAFGFGRTKVESKGEAADSMVRKIFTYAKTGDLDNSSDEQRMKIVEYLRELMRMECGGDQPQISNEEVIKKWLELRQKFPSAKAKPTKVMDFKVRHCFFKNLTGPYVSILKDSSGEELADLVGQGMDFLERLGEEQNFTFRSGRITADGEEKLWIITMDAEVPLAFHGKDKTAFGAKENCIKNCLHTLRLLLE